MFKAVEVRLVASIKTSWAMSENRKLAGRTVGGNQNFLKPLLSEAACPSYALRQGDKVIIQRTYFSR